MRTPRLHSHVVDQGRRDRRPPRLPRPAASLSGSTQAGSDGAAPPAGLSGALDIVGLPTVLTMLEMERQSGVVEVRAGDALACLFVREGRPVRARLLAPSAERGRAALYAALALSGGTFVFRRCDVAENDELGGSLAQLLLEAARLSDELAA